MTPIAYIKDRAMLLVLHIVCMLFAVIFLKSVDNPNSVIYLMLLIWFVILTTYLTVHYVSRRKYLKQLQEMSDSLEQRYLLAEVMDKPFRLEDLEYYKLLKSANKSMIEQVTKVRDERKEYKEYIEQWVHQIKTPIAAIKLICENQKSDVTRKVLIELERTDQYVEQALYYARSEQVEKDYLIKEIALSDCVHAAIIKNKQLLIQNSIQIHTEELDRIVYSDSKWIEFMINQLLINAVKYRKQGQEPSMIKFSTEEVKNGISLVIRDNGLGIAENELPRVFNKGFTGSNGRQNQQSTGIGLYLCRRLCDKLGLEITINSVPNEYTALTIFFPIGTLYQMQE